MSKRNKMTVDISVKLHQEVKEQAGMHGMTLSKYVVLAMQSNIFKSRELNFRIRKLHRLLNNARSAFKTWRFIAVVLFIALIILLV